MRKRILACLLAMVSLFTFAACAGNDSSTNSPSDEQTSSTPDIPNSDNPAETPEKEIYTVTFKQNGFDPIVKTVEEGEALTDIPSTQEKIGYTVIWETVDLTNIAEDIVVNAVETANIYTVTYDAGAEATVTPTEAEVTYDSVATHPTPEKEGYGFIAWLYEGTAVTGKWTIAKDVTLTASWQEIIPETYTVTFLQNGFDPIVKTVEEGETLTDIPPVQIKEGYNIVWEEKDFTNITENITVNAIETAKTYTAKLTTSFGTLETTTVVFTYGETYTLPTLMDSDKMMTFAYWTYNGVKLESSGTWMTDVTEEIELVAVWNKNYTGLY